MKFYIVCTSVTSCHFTQYPQDTLSDLEIFLLNSYSTGLYAFITPNKFITKQSGMLPYIQKHFSVNVSELFTVN